MKTSITRSLGVVICVCFIALYSCNSVDYDALKVAQLQCHAKKLAIRAMDGDMDILKKSEDLHLEARKLINDCRMKYVTVEEKEAFWNALVKACRNCK